MADYILQENGDKILQETGDGIFSIILKTNK